MAEPKETSSNDALVWATLEVRALFPDRPLDERETARYETVCRDWARDYKCDPAGTAAELARKIAFERSRSSAIEAIAELDRAAGDYFGTDYATLRGDIMAEALQSAARST